LLPSRLLPGRGHYHIATSEGITPFLWLDAVLSSVKGFSTAALFSFH